MDCGGVFVKYVLFVFNILCLICGVLLIVFGSILVSHIKHFSDFEEAYKANSVSIIILILGCVIFIVAFLGCCGAIREDSCALTTYSIIMLCLFLCQIALVIYIWVDHVQIRESLDKVVEAIWNQRKSSDALMSSLQRTLQCCGLNKYYDYGIPPYPASCCDSPTNGSCSVIAVYSQGCRSRVDYLWDTNANIIKYAGLGVTAIELVAFIFAFCLANQTRNSDRRQNY